MYFVNSNYTWLHLCSGIIVQKKERKRPLGISNNERENEKENVVGRVDDKRSKMHQVVYNRERYEETAREEMNKGNKKRETQKE